MSFEVLQGAVASLHFVFVSSDHPRVHRCGSLGWLFGGAIGSFLTLPVSRYGFPLPWQTRWVKIVGRGILPHSIVLANCKDVPDYSRPLLLKDVPQEAEFVGWKVIVEKVVLHRCNVLANSKALPNCSGS